MCPCTTVHELVGDVLCQRLQIMLFISKSFGTSGINAIGSFQLSQLNSSSVQSQLKAAGIDTNSKQYKAAVNDVEKSNLSMVCDTSG